MVRSSTGEPGRFIDQRALLALALEYRLANRFFPELRRRLFDALATSPRKAVLSEDQPFFSTARPLEDRSPDPTKKANELPVGSLDDSVLTEEDPVMAVMRYEPWNVVSQLQSEINRVFGNLNDTDSSSATSEWSPAVDVREYPDRFQLLLDVPGVEPKDVEITLDNGVLSVSGNRSEEKAVGNGAEQPQQQRIERRLGRFHRRFILPDTADGENVNASGRNGVLEIVIPKQPRAQPRRIAVK